MVLPLGLLIPLGLLTVPAGISGLPILLRRLPTLVLTRLLATARLLFQLRLWPWLTGRRPLVDNQGLPLGAGLIGPLRPGISCNAAIFERRPWLGPQLPRHQQRSALKDTLFLGSQQNDLTTGRSILQPHFQPHSGKPKVGITRPHANPNCPVGRHSQGGFLWLQKRNLGSHVSHHLDSVLQLFRDDSRRLTAQLPRLKEQSIRRPLRSRTIAIKPQLKRYRSPRRVARADQEWLITPSVTSKINPGGIHGSVGHCHDRDLGALDGPDIPLPADGFFAKPRIGRKVILHFLYEQRRCVNSKHLHRFRAGIARGERQFN